MGCDPRKNLWTIGTRLCCDEGLSGRPRGRGRRGDAARVRPDDWPRRLREGCTADRLRDEPGDNHVPCAATPAVVATRSRRRDSGRHGADVRAACRRPDSGRGSRTARRHLLPSRLAAEVRQNASAQWCTCAGRGSGGVCGPTASVAAVASTGVARRMGRRLSLGSRTHLSRRMHRAVPHCGRWCSLCIRTCHRRSRRRVACRREEGRRRPPDICLHGRAPRHLRTGIRKPGPEAHSRKPPRAQPCMAPSRSC